MSHTTGPNLARKLTIAALIAVLLASAAPGYTNSSLSDTESVSASVSAEATAELDVAFSPEPYELDRTDEATVAIGGVTNGTVSAETVSVTVNGSELPVRQQNDCDGANCTLVVRGAAVDDAVGQAPGTYRLAASGAFEDGQSFKAVTTVVVEEPPTETSREIEGDPSGDERSGENETNHTTATPAETTTETVNATANETDRDDATETSTETATTTESANATTTESANATTSEETTTTTVEERSTTTPTEETTTETTGESATETVEEPTETSTETPSSTPEETATATETERTETATANGELTETDGSGTE